MERIYRLIILSFLSRLFQTVPDKISVLFILTKYLNSIGVSFNEMTRKSQDI